jgi:hypothetical protein
MTCIPPEDRPIGDVNTCSGIGIQGSQIANYWCNNDCPGAYSLYINSNTSNVVGFNQANFMSLQSLISTSLFPTFLNTNQFTNNQNSPQYSGFQSTLIDMCLDPRLSGTFNTGSDTTFSGNVCDTALINYCANDVPLIQNETVREQVEVSPVLTSLCGCYVPPDPTSISPQCDPLCVKATSIKQGGLLCNNDVCAISDVSINLTKTTLGTSGITFSNLCPQCAGQGCICIISGVNTTNTLKSIGVNSQFNQLCGPQSKCFNNGVEVPCLSSPPTVSSLPSWIYWFIVILIFLLIIIIIMMMVLKP